MAQTALGPWTFALDMGNHWELIIVPGVEANEDFLRMSFQSSIK